LATTKAFELAQLSALTDVGTDVTITDLVDQVVVGSTSDNTANALIVKDSSNVNLLRVRNDGVILIEDNYLYVSATAGSFFDGPVRFRNGITNDTAGAKLNLSDVEGVDVTSTTTSTSSTTGALTVGGGAGIAENLNVGGNIVVTGDLTVEGSQVTLNTTALDVEDKNITLNYHATNDTSASADGAGITIQDAVDASTNASILWNATNSAFDFSHEITAPSALTLTSNAPRIFLYEADTTDLNTALFSSGGKFTIRTTTDDDATRTTRLEVSHSTGDVGFYEDNSGTPQVGMHWDYTDGRLGIGTTAPTSTVDIRGPNGAVQSRGQLYLTNTDTAAINNGSQISLGGTYSGTGDTYFAAIAGRKENSTVGDFHGYLQLSTRQASGNIERVRITSDGKVGIGTTDPNALLDLEGVTASSSPILRFTGTGNASAGDVIGQIEFYNSDATDFTPGIMGAIRAIAGPSGGEGHLQFLTDMPSEGTDAATVALHLHSTGNVGIGTDSPDSKLTVNVSTTGDGIELQSSTTSIASFARSVVDGQVVASIDGVSTRPIHIGGVVNEDVILGYGGGNVGVGIPAPSAFLDVRKDNNNVGDQFRVADTEGTTAGIRTYTTSNGTGIILNHYYAKSGGGNKYVRYGDIVSNMADGAASMLRFLTKDKDVNARVAMTLSETGAIGTSAQQVRHDLQPSLSFNFANSKTLDPRIQYQRRGTATYFDDSGVMRYATHNVPRIDHDPSTGECKGLLVEEERTNFMPHPNEFGFGQWATPGLVPIQNVGLAPDGTYSADLIMLDYSYTSRHFGYRGVTGAFLSGMTYNISCYFKAYGGFSETCKLGYRVDSDTQNGDLYGSSFSIDAGEPAGNGWYRHSLTVAVSTNATFNFAEFLLGNQNGYQPTAGTGVYMWGFTVEKASNNTGATFPTSFIPTKANLTGRASTTATYTRSDGVITTANEHQPRYDHAIKDGIWRRKGLLLESAATNLSQNFYYPASTLKWNSGVQNATITPVTSELAPDGSYNNVVRFKETTNNAATTASVYKPIAGTANTQRTFSVYAKKKELKMMRLYFDGTTPLCGQVIYNLDLGTIHIAQNPSGTDAWGIEDAGNGWWRCWFSGTVTGGQSTYYLHIDSADDFGNTSHQNTVNNGFYLWGPQMEYGGGPTSYIYTDDSAVTRTADLAETEAVTREGDNIKMYDMSFHNTIESTIYGEGTSISGNNDTGSNPCLWGLTDGTSSNRYLLRRFSNDTTNDPTYSGFTFRLQQTMPDGTSYNNDFFSPTANGLGEWDDAEIHKMAMSISPGNQIGAADGNDSGMTSVTNMPPYTQAIMVEIGFAGSSDYWNGHIRKLSYYPTQLNITELKALTESD
jgi:hypothetical protein